MSSNTYRNSFRVGFIVFGVLILHAFLYYKKRVVVPDAAFYLFELLRTGQFSIMHARFIAVATQWLPFLGLKLHASLDTITLLYSISFPIYYLLVYSICGILFKNYKAAIAFLIFLVLISTHTQYWMLSELSLGASFIFILLAYFGSPYAEKGIGIGTLVLFALSSVIISSSHPLLIFPMVFFIAYEWLIIARHKKSLIALTLLYIIAFVLKKALLSDAYDENAMNNLNSIVRNFPNYINLDSNRRLLANSFGIWWGIPLGAIAVIWTCYKQKRKLVLRLFSIFFFGYLFLINVCFSGGDVLAMYIENFYLVLGVFIAIPLVYELGPTIKNPKIVTFGFTTLMIFCLVRIFIMGNFYSKRLDWERSLVHKYVGQKVILEHSKNQPELLSLSWCVSFEIWLISTIEQHSSASIIMHENPELRPEETSNDPKLFICAWSSYPYSGLKAPYFQFKDTTSIYQHIWE